MLPKDLSSSPKGFTLIELLAVIAVISVLVAMLVAGISKAREKANVASSLSNLRQVGSAVLTYAAEHGNQLPNQKDSRNPNFVSRNLMDPYLDYDNSAWICPILAELEQTSLREDDQGRFFYSWRLTNSTDGWRDDAEAVRLHTIVRPSEAMVAANLSAGARGGYWDGFANVLFADGSVRRVSDPTYRGGNVNSEDGVNRRYLQSSGGRIRGYDY